MLGTARALRTTVIGCAVILGCGGGESAAPTSPGANGPTPEREVQKAPTADATTKTSTPSAASTDGSWPFAAPTPDERTAQLERLKGDAGPIKSNWSPPGKSDRYGHAEGLVNAPPDALKAKLVDFAHYKDLAGPKFRTVKVVDKQGDATDVYFQLPIMKGVVVIWYITRFTPAKSNTSGHVVEGTFVKGNIKGMHIAFTVRPAADEKSSVMMCDLVLQPNVPAPQSALDEELRDACGDAINAVRRTLSGS